jgi:hypothetical protein
MNDFLDQIEIANNAGLYYVSLFCSLGIPDICGALEAEDGGGNRSRYISWFDNNVSGISMTGEDCYYFRCSMLHQGSTQHPSSTYTRIIFIEPTGYSGVAHNNVLMDALNIDVRVFCGEILAAARRWLPAVQGSDPYERNYSRFVRRYPNGLSPYIGGVPVIG